MVIVDGVGYFIDSISVVIVDGRHDRNRVWGSWKSRANSQAKQRSYLTRPPGSPIAFSAWAPPPQLPSDKPPPLPGQLATAKAFV
jgi:hypothetical protein